MSTRVTKAALTALTVYVIARSSFNAAEQWQKYADINWIITDKWSSWTYDLDICLAFLPVLVMLLALLQFNYHELKYKKKSMRNEFKETVKILS